MQRVAEWLEFLCARKRLAGGVIMVCVSLALWPKFGSQRRLYACWGRKMRDPGSMSRSGPMLAPNDIISHLDIFQLAPA